MSTLDELSLFMQGYKEGFARCATLLQERANAQAHALARSGAPQPQTPASAADEHTAEAKPNGAASVPRRRRPKLTGLEQHVLETISSFPEGITRPELRELGVPSFGTLYSLVRRRLVRRQPIPDAPAKGPRVKFYPVRPR